MCLSRIQSLAVAAVLEDCADELDVLGLTLGLRATKERGPAKAQEKARLTNLRSECQSISQQMLTLSSELEEMQTFSILLKPFEEMKQKREAEDMKRQAMAERMQRITTLKAEVQQKKCILKERSMHLERLQEQATTEATRKRREEKSLALQREHVLNNNRKAEKQLEDQREMLKMRLMEEKQVHEKSVKVLQNRHEELLLLHQQWEQRTVQMLQEKKQELASVRCKRTLNADKLSEMRRKIREMEQVVMEDREEQEKLRQQLMEARAATKVQRWWRSCMARRGLGSFKKADDKQGEKKKMKKKKKKEMKKK